MLRRHLAQDVRLIVHLRKGEAIGSSLADALAAKGVLLAPVAPVKAAP
jgi:hypothetical protein